MPPDPLELFHAPTRAWFEQTLGPPTRPQSLAWPEIARGATTLVLAPTGSGKTLAAFLAAIDRLMWAPLPPPKARCRVLYVSPLKALAVDVERNLDRPIRGIEEAAAGMNITVHRPSVFVRTGDTPASDRVRMRRAPPDILITTPESLFLVLTSGARELLRSVETVIVDEIHSLVASKRGAHLFLSLERLEKLRDRPHPLQRIGLSATQKPLDVVARLLGGFDGSPRAVSIIDASAPKPLELQIVAPAIDMSRLGESDSAETDDREREASQGSSHRSLWPHLHEEIVRLVRPRRSTMIFVNSRRLAERLASALNDLAGEELALAHHGSVARDRRAVIEDRLKRGDLKAIVATSSLELGIDMGSVDLVIQVESPPSVASGLQRIGRAGHSVGDVSRGVLLPKHRGDLLACAAAVERMQSGDVESTYYPKNPLDVLAQQIVAIASSDVVGTDELYALVRRAAPFAELSRGAFESVLDMLSGRYASGELPGLRARITWDRKRGRVAGREGSKALAIANAGTIPDRGLYGVFLGEGDPSRRTASRRVGELDEEMVFELREGEVFLLGASSWRAERIGTDRVIVTPAPGQPGKMPFWHGDRAGRPLAFGRAIGKLTRELSQMAPAAARAKLLGMHAMNESACENLLSYVRAQVAATGEVPSDQTILIERLVDAMGDSRICLLTPFGSRVHAPWCTAVLERLSSELGQKADGVWSDDGIVFRLPTTAAPPPVDWFIPPSCDVEAAVTLALGHSALFASHFREGLGRALLLPRRRPGMRTPLWAQRKRASDLLARIAEFPDFPILLETYRECLSDVFDMPGLVQTLRAIESRETRVHVVDPPSPSPFATSLLFSFVANFMYEGDAPLAERRAHALAIDHGRLRELLGESDRRNLLDPDVLSDHLRVLSRADYEIRHADGLHDLLLQVGDLSLSEIRARSRGPVEAWLDALNREERILQFFVAGETRYAAIEDAGRLRDALRVTPPKGTPEAFLDGGTAPLSDLIARYARTHGPFTPEDVSGRWGLLVSSLAETLEALVLRGKLVRGEYLPGGKTIEYCDAEVLRALRHKSLAKTREAVEPVVAEVYARFSVEWQLAPRRGPGALIDAIRQLEGCPLLISALEEDILPARVPGYRSSDLDALCASGQVVWAGVEPVGHHDGRIVLFLAEHEAVLGPCAVPRDAVATSAVSAKLRELLLRRGAIFFAEIARELGGFQSELVDGLWELVWAGEVTNDTLEVLRRRRVPQEARGNPRRSRLVRGATQGLPPGTQGRWSLRRPSSKAAPSDTEQRAAVARMFLDRYGVVGRESADAESLPGGFSLVYDVLKGMEEAGRIRRGYFVEGMSATQFALPGADDRLRALREPGGTSRTVLLAATDPANPYGGVLPWPKARSADGHDFKGGAPQRAAGARVILCDGKLLGWLGRAGHSLIVFVDPRDNDAARLFGELARELANLVEGGKRKVLLVQSIDGDTPRRSPLFDALLAAGFTGGSRGLQRRRAFVQ